MSTAFLQTLPTEEEKRLWTYGVKEVREALQVPEGGVLRILKNFYGSTSAPRNLWQNVDGALKGLGAIKIKGDPCFWLWLEDRVDLNPVCLPRILLVSCPVTSMTFTEPGKQTIPNAMLFARRLTTCTNGDL